MDDTPSLKNLLDSPTTKRFLEPGAERKRSNLYLEVEGEKPGTRRYVDMGEDSALDPGLFTGESDRGVTPDEVRRWGAGVKGAGMDTGSLGRKSFATPDAYGADPRNYSHHEITPMRLRGTAVDWDVPVRPKNPTKQVNVDSPAGTKPPGPAGPSELGTPGTLPTESDDASPGLLATTLGAGAAVTTGTLAYKTISDAFERTGTDSARHWAARHSSVTDLLDEKMGKLPDGSGAQAHFDDIAQRVDAAKKSATDPGKQIRPAIDKVARATKEILGAQWDKTSNIRASAVGKIKDIIKSGGNPAAIAHAEKVRSMAQGTWGMAGRAAGAVGNLGKAAAATKVGGAVAKGARFLGRGGLPLPYGAEESLMRTLDTMWDTSDSGGVLMPEKVEMGKNLTAYGGKAKPGATVNFSDAPSVAKSWRGGRAKIVEADGQKFAVRLTPVRLDEVKRARKFLEKTQVGSHGTGVFNERLKRDLNRDDFDLDDYSNPLVPDMVRTISNWAQATDQTLKGIADKETRSATEKEITKQLLTVMNQKFKAYREEGLKQKANYQKELDEMGLFERLNETETWWGRGSADERDDLLHPMLDLRKKRRIVAS